jgi:hypothetical protein
MFDQETAPKKLVSIPIAEISHREGSSFRKFVAEDLRDDAQSAGMVTPSHSYADDPAGSIPPMPMSPGSPGGSTTSPHHSPS